MASPYSYYASSAPYTQSYDAPEQASRSQLALLKAYLSEQPLELSAAPDAPRTNMAQFSHVPVQRVLAALKRMRLAHPSLGPR